MDSTQIQQAYSAYVSKHNERPKNMAFFAESMKINESKIYAYFTSFNMIEESILNHFVKNAIDLSKESDHEMHPKESILTFYFTFMEVLKSNRSLVLFILPKNKVSTLKTKVLNQSKSSFLEFLKELNIDFSAFSFIPDSDIKNKTSDVLAWVQFESILWYWVKDESINFEKTDVFIEKSLKLSFEIIESNITESLVDFGKFIFKK